jgi:DNA-binding NtrC family response regulator
MNESTHRCAVLIVDDDPDMRELLRVALAADRYDVTAVSNGRDALIHLRSTPETCMIVLDLSLPAMDGMQFRAAQRRDRSLAWIPVVVLSGAIDGPALAHDMGAAAFVPKPVDLDRLLGAMHRIGCCQAYPRREQRVS